MRVALLVGIDYYTQSPLVGCVKDAEAIGRLLAEHHHGEKNFDINFLKASDRFSALSRIQLKRQIQKLFAMNIEIALLYFSGHGYIEKTGGYLSTSESQHGDDGLSMNELLQIVNSSPALNKVILLDCCYAGIFGNQNPKDAKAILAEGVTVLAASNKTQVAQIKNGISVFSQLVLDALNGGAANLLGEITPGNIYAHIDQALGPWEQRPNFKTNINSFVSLRKVKPPIDLSLLKKITTLFKDKNYDFPLDPTYEPTSPTALSTHIAEFSILQKYYRVNLVVPVDEEHMYFAAMNSKACRLTLLGQHYWTLVRKKRLGLPSEINLV